MVVPWQPEKQEKRKWDGKDNYKVAKNNARAGFQEMKGKLWLFCKNKKLLALKVPLQWACCRSPKLCPEPRRMHFPAFLPKSAQNCRSRCCRLDQQISALRRGGKKIIFTLNVLRILEVFRCCFDIIQETFMLFITHFVEHFKWVWQDKALRLHPVTL